MEYTLAYKQKNWTGVLTYPSSAIRLIIS